MISLAVIPSVAYLPGMGKPTTKTGHGGVRPGSGRKPSPRRTLKRNRVVLLLDDAEWRVLSQAAGKQRLSEFAREVVFRSLARRGK